MSLFQALCSHMLTTGKMESCREEKSGRMGLAGVWASPLTSTPRCPHMVMISLQCVFCLLIVSWSTMIQAFIKWKEKSLSSLFKTYLIDLLAVLSPSSLRAKCLSVCLNYSVSCSSVMSKPLTYIFNKNLEFSSLIL